VVSLHTLARGPAARPGLLGLFFLLAITAAGGCIDKGAAALLAQQGKDAAAAGSGSFKSLSGGLEDALGQRFIQMGIRGTDPADEKLASVERQIQEQITEAQGMLAARRKMLEELGTLYTTFGELAALDANTETSTAAGNLGKAINGYAVATKQAVPIDDSEMALIQQLAGAAAEWYQGRKIKRNSEAIRTLAGHVVTVLENEERAYSVYASLTSETSAQLASDLFAAGIGRPHPILRKVVEAHGLAYDEAGVNALFDGKLKPKDMDVTIAAVRRGISRYITGQSQVASARRMAVTQGTISALKKLQEEHEKLEQGKPVDIATLSATIDRLKTFIELLNKAAD
jgi:hypothetical protein